LIEATPLKGNDSNSHPITRALYQITQPIDGTWATTTLVEVPPKSKDSLDGVNVNRMLYRIHLQVDGPQSVRHTMLTAQQSRCFQGVVMKQSTSLGVNWEARSRGVSGDNNILLYSGKPKSDGEGLEWRDSKENLVAVETQADQYGIDRESLDILVPLEADLLDLLVALWVARIWRDAKTRDDEEETRKAKLKLKQDEKERDKKQASTWVLHILMCWMGNGADEQFK
jgi:hypothetical protein